MPKPKVEVVVRKDHKFRGQRRTKGETMSVSHRDAKMLATLGWAVVKRVQAEAPKVEAPKPKREYKRRDVVPPVREVLEPEAPVVIGVDPASGPDMTSVTAVEDKAE